MKIVAVTVQVAKEIAAQANGLVIWVYDKTGKMLEKQIIKNGSAKLKIDSRSLVAKAKLYITPEIPELPKRRVPRERFLIQAGAYQPSLKLTEAGVLDIATIPNLDKFRFRICNITGTVSKNFTLDGVAKIMPVCDVRIHICEVDPFWFILPKIPDPDILDIRDRLLDAIATKWPPIPDPVGPVIDPIGPVVGPGIRPIGLPPVNKQIAAVDNDRMTAQKLLMTYSVDALRSNLINNYRLFLPYLCLFPKRWPFLYHCEEIAVVQSDCNGRFNYRHVYLESGDQPDIYIWIEANINGSWETVYRPPVACSTRWDYACGSDINITVNDDRLRPCECDAMPGQVVWVKRVGDGRSIRGIQQLSGGSVHLADAIGLTDAYRTGEFTSPFGNVFPFVVQFGSGFPSSTVKYYRWKYRQLLSANLSPLSADAQTFEGAIAKPYTYERVNSDGDTLFYTGSYAIGPVFGPQGAMFKIPHSEASVDIPAEPTAEWNQDTYSVNVNSLSLNDGLYEFTLELLDNNGNVVPQDKDVFVVDKKLGELSNPPDAPTITAYGRPEPYVVLNAANQAVGFRFVMRIDNDACHADIHNALVDGHATETVCGFGQYADKNTSKVTLEFEASQPQRFGHYYFSVVKGNGNYAGPTNTSGYLSQANFGYSVVGNIYSKAVDAKDMLGACNKAAFAENLTVQATHTNGSRRLDEYDRYDVAAFAIEPATGP